MKRTLALAPVKHWVKIVFCSLVPLFLWGQSGDTDGGEVSAFVGGAFGLGSHPSIGGSTGGVISKHAMVFFEGSYTALGPYTIQPWPARANVARSNLTDFNVNFQIRIPVSQRLAPYGIIGVGFLWDALREQTFLPNGVAVGYHFDQFNAAVHTGGGFRYYLGENWGIRPEFRVIVTKHTFTRASIGFFYVVPSNWP